MLLVLPVLMVMMLILGDVLLVMPKVLFQIHLKQKIITVTLVLLVIIKMVPLMMMVLLNVPIVIPIVMLVLLPLVLPVKLLLMVL